MTAIFFCTKSPGEQHPLSRPSANQRAPALPLPPPWSGTGRSSPCNPELPEAHRHDARFGFGAFSDAVSPAFSTRAMFRPRTRMICNPPDPATPPPG